MQYLMMISDFLIAVQGSILLYTGVAAAEHISESKVRPLPSCLIVEGCSAGSDEAAAIFHIFPDDIHVFAADAGRVRQYQHF